jgi:hypothetical protein
MRQGIEAMWTTGAELNRPCFLVQLAEVDVHIGQPETARALLDEAMALMDKNAERWWEAALYRVRGELLLRQAIGADWSLSRADPPGPLPAGGGTIGLSPLIIETEAAFQRALDVARPQEAKMLELRAAVSLNRLWQHRGGALMPDTC